MRAFAAVLLAVSGCPQSQTPRSYPEPRVVDVLARLREVDRKTHNLRAETRSDVRLGKDRVNVEVLILVAWGGKLRYQAFYPNGSMAADLASDGERYCMIDVEHNCGACGPATAENVGRLLTVTLDPNDVVTMMMGRTPILADPQGTVTWDPNDGTEIVELHAGELRQKIVLDGRDGRWDVLSSEVRDPRDNIVWRIRHKGFHDVGPVRLPKKSWFEESDSDAMIEWRKQELNIEIPDERFTLTLPTGLPQCRQ